MMKTNNRCSICGKKLNTLDKELGFKYNGKVGYGSVHDGEHIQLNICCDCFDKIVEKQEKREKETKKLIY